MNSLNSTHVIVQRIHWLKNFYKDNQMVTTNNITSRMCSVNVE